MKKNIFSWMTIMLMAFVCVGFTACGDDDDSGETGGGDSSGAGTFQGAKRVFGDNLVKVITRSDTPSSVSRWEFTYDANGYMTKAQEGTYSNNYDLG